MVPCIYKFLFCLLVWKEFWSILKGDYIRETIQILKGEYLLSSPCAKVNNWIIQKYAPNLWGKKKNFYFFPCQMTVANKKVEMTSIRVTILPYLAPLLINSKYFAKWQNTSLTKSEIWKRTMLLDCRNPLPWCLEHHFLSL